MDTRLHLFACVAGVCMCMLDFVTILFLYPHCQYTSHGDYRAQPRSKDRSRTKMMQKLGIRVMTREMMLMRVMGIDGEMGRAMGAQKMMMIFGMMMMMQRLEKKKFQKRMLRWKLR